MRTAATIVNVSKRYKSRIFLHCSGDCKNCRYANSCSTLQLLALQIKQGQSVTITANGPDEEEALEELYQILAKRKND